MTVQCISYRKSLSITERTSLICAFVRRQCLGCQGFSRQGLIELLLEDNHFVFEMLRVSKLNLLVNHYLFHHTFWPRDRDNLLNGFLYNIGTKLAQRSRGAVVTVLPLVCAMCILEDAVKLCPY